MSEILTPFITKQITAAYKAGYRQRMEDCGELPYYMTMNEAYEKYGRKNVDKWIDEELIKTSKTGEHRTSRRLIVRSEIEMLAAINEIKPKQRKPKTKKA
jgi:hypothetical protein